MAWDKVGSKITQLMQLMSGANVSVQVSQPKEDMRSISFDS